MPEQKMTAGEASPNDPRVKALRERVKEDLAAQTAATGAASPDAIRAMIAETVATVNRATGFADEGGEAEIAQMLADDYVGLGPIERLIREGGHSEIMVNGGGVDRATGREGAVPVYVEDGGVLTPRPDVVFDDEDAAGQKRRIVERIASMNDIVVNDEMPILDASLYDGSRVHAVLYPVSDFGTTIDIRVFSKEKMTIDQLIRFGTLTPNMARTLKALVLARCNVIVSGGTGSGKTTMLNCLSEFFPANERIDTIEDTRELQLKQRHWNAYHSRRANGEGAGEITIRQLLQGSLRNRPDRIVVGECRGEETLEMLQAMQSGHDGSLTTVHASNVREALSRIETMVQYGQSGLNLTAIRRQIEQAVDVIVQVGRLRDGRRAVLEVSVVTGMEGDTITLEPLFKLETHGIDADGSVVGDFCGCGILPPQRVLDKLNTAGAEWERDWFFERVPMGDAYKDFEGISPVIEEAPAAPSTAAPAKKPAKPAPKEGGGLFSDPEPANGAPKPPAGYTAPSAQPEEDPRAGMPEDLIPGRAAKRKGFPWAR